ncbi:hypothetical protein SAMN05216228_11281 [Rhizobium tibeticum]|uniref:Orotate phosphoribosyltransferase n=1 Tax=Rhizobium tibeticum TaxID=501024 RepID=A0ABY1AZ55_9HYPH|nr:hypothetical protein SAMN05216228_11281 [Rhizobium tibeticum]
MTELAAHEFWQKIHSPGTFRSDGDFSTSYIATLEDGRQLRLPVRVLADGQHALASLIINQASFEILDVLAQSLAEKLQSFEVDVVAGLPTLGLTLAAAVAQKLGRPSENPVGDSSR